jgi:tripartite-type tricarboxylate transporter receptor subunit TctC
MAVGWPVLAAPYISRAAEAYPTRRVTIINQFAPGSISDAAARLIAQSLQDQLGQPFIVENKVGAGGLVAATAVSRAYPDGYTLLATASSFHSAAALYKDLPIDPLKDFHPYRPHRQLSLVHRGAFEPASQFDPGTRRLRQECSRQVDVRPWQQPGAVDR